MNISELNYNALSEEDMYNLIMSEVKDYELEEPTDKTKSDIIIVLGCAPRPLNSRIKKMIALCKKGYSDKILLSGGRGWQKLIKQNPERKPEFIKTIKSIITSELLGDNPTLIEKETYNKFNEQIKKIIGDRYHSKSYQERLDEDKLQMTEEEFMQLIIFSQGGLKGVQKYSESFSTNTKENSYYVGKIFDGIKNGSGKAIESAIVVTSSFHCTRSKLTFMKNFPNIKFNTCPSTEDIIKEGLNGISIEMMNNEKYKKYILNETQKIIEYSKKGDIYDAELTDLVSKQIAKTIEEKQNQYNKENER